MANAGIMIGWSRAIAGREAIANTKFAEFGAYLGKLQAENRIESFEPVIMRPHGGDLNGFFLVRGTEAKLAELRATDHWKDWETWGGFHMDNFGAVDCMLGDSIGTSMARWAKHIQK